MGALLVVMLLSAALFGVGCGGGGDDGSERVEWRVDPLGVVFPVANEIELNERTEPPQLRGSPRQTVGRGRCQDLDGEVMQEDGKFVV